MPVCEKMLVFHREAHANLLIGSGKAAEIVAHAKEHGLRADVRRVVDRRPARVHADRLAVRWGEWFDLAREGVIEAEGHGRAEN